MPERMRAIGESAARRSRCVRQRSCSSDLPPAADREASSVAGASQSGSPKGLRAYPTQIRLARRKSAVVVEPRSSSRDPREIVVCCATASCLPSGASKSGSMFEKNSLEFGLRCPTAGCRDRVEARPRGVEDVRELQLPVEEALPCRHALGDRRVSSGGAASVVGSGA